MVPIRCQELCWCLYKRMLSFYPSRDGQRSHCYCTHFIAWKNLGVREVVVTCPRPSARGSGGQRALVHLYPRFWCWAFAVYTPDPLWLNLALNLWPFAARMSHRKLSEQNLDTWTPRRGCELLCKLTRLLWWHLIFPFSVEHCILEGPEGFWEHRGVLSLFPNLRLYLTEHWHVTSQEGWSHMRPQLTLTSL